MLTNLIRILTFVTVDLLFRYIACLVFYPKQPHRILAQIYSNLYNFMVNYSFLLRLLHLMEEEKVDLKIYYINIKITQRHYPTFWV